MAKAIPTKSDSVATLTITVVYQQARLTDVLEAAKEVIEKASEQGAVSGHLELHHNDRIDVEDLR